MTSKTKTVERNASCKSNGNGSVWVRSVTANSEWPDKVNKQDDAFRNT